MNIDMIRPEILENGIRETTEVNTFEKNAI